MDLASVRALATGLTFAWAPCAVDATVTVPSGSPVTTRVIWMTPSRRQTTDEVYDPTVELRQRQPDRRSMTVPRDTVSSVPLGTVVVAPEASGGVAQNWRVDGIERIEADRTRVVVVPA